MTTPSKSGIGRVVVRALHSRQGNQDLYAFFLAASRIREIADIERLSRNGRDRLKGFQRPEIRQHVKSIVAYLNHGTVIFPNAIILAIAPTVRFVGSRGPNKQHAIENTHAGYLTLPLLPEGERVAWIVDGQQRSIALSQATNSDLPVPVIAFVSDDLEVQREQFILVNKARPLPQRLIDELLPVTSSAVLPSDLASRRIPSALCDALAKDRNSPFHGLIRRPSMGPGPERVVLDSAVTRMIRDRIYHPLGALASFRAYGESKANVQRMYQALVAYWSAVKAVFPDAWGKPPAKSRLMHSAGIAALGLLMDRIVSRVGTPENLSTKVRAELRPIAQRCAWTSGTWPFIGVRWDAIESTPRDIRMLADALVRMCSERGT